MSDRGDIVELVVRFADAVNRLDIAQFERTWAPQAHWVIDPPTGLDMAASREEIAGMFGEAMPANWASFTQLVHGTVVDLDGDRATARSYLTEIAAPLQGDHGYYNHGLYLDDLERTAEGWCFTKRHYRYLLLNDEPVTARTAPVGGVL